MIIDHDPNEQPRRLSRPRRPVIYEPVRPYGSLPDIVVVVSSFVMIGALLWAAGRYHNSTQAKIAGLQAELLRVQAECLANDANLTADQFFKKHGLRGTLQ